MRRSLRTTRITALLLAAALGLAGCTAFGGGSSSSDSGTVSQGGTGQGGTEEAPNGVTAPDVAGGTVAGGTVAEGERQVVQTGYATITVSDPAAAADDAARIAVANGGRVDDRSQQSADGTAAARATLTIRVPASALDSTLQKLEALGDPVSVSVSANDVTATVTDLDARIAALQSSVDRLLALLSQADTTADLIEIESSLSSRQADLDALKAQRASLGEQVAMSTITVDLVAPGTVVGSGPRDFWQGLAAGWDGLLAAGTGLLIVVGVLIPWLIPVAVVLLVILVLVRRMRHRPAASAPAPAPGPAPAPPTPSSQEHPGM